MAGTDKITRILALYNQFISGKQVNKANFCQEFNILPRSFDRDIEDIRLFLSESYSFNEVNYVKEANAYQLSHMVNKKLSGEETVVLASMLFSLKTFRKDELEELLKNLIDVTELQYRESLYRIIRNKIESYGSLKTDRASLKIQWDMERCILKRKMITLDYQKGNGEYVKRSVKPMEILYDDGYVYLVAYRCGENYRYPAFYRLDRVDSFKVEEGVFTDRELDEYKKLDIRSYLKYMQAGELLSIKVKCDVSKSRLVEESFKESELIEKNEKECVFLIKSFEQGFIQWLLGQGSAMEVLEPVSLRQKVINMIETLRKVYMGEGEERGKEN